jgi:hypothetical protein
MAAFLIAASPAAGEDRKGFALLGCWKHTSSFSIEDTPPGWEWGERTWCFRDGGNLDTWSIACGGPVGKPKACDGWAGRFTWNWDGLSLGLEDYRCRVERPGPDRFILRNCPQSEDPWVRTEDPESKKKQVVQTARQLPCISVWI